MTLGEALVKIGFNVDQSSSNAATAKFKQIKSTAVKLLGAIGIGFSFSAMNSLAEEFNGINDSIRAATRGMGEQLDIQQQVMEAANATKMSYSDMAGAVTQLIQTDKDLFSDLETATDFATLTAKTLKAAGRSDSEVSSAQSQLNRVIAAGSMEASTFTRILRTYPELINTMADGLGVTTDELQAMCEAGQVTSETMVQAFSNASDTIDSNFGELDYSISDALTNIRNQWGLFCDQLWVGSNITNGIGNIMVEVFQRFLSLLKKLQPAIERIVRAGVDGIQKALGFMDKVGNVIKTITDRLGGAKNVAKLFGAVLGTLAGIFAAAKIISGIEKIKGLFTATNLKVVGIIAVIVLLVLLVEDFINFLQGNDSVLGTVFDKLGIDSEAVRDTILGAFDKVKEFFEEHLPQIQATFEAVWGAIKAVVSAVMNAIWSIIQSAVNLIMAIWDRWGTQITNIVTTVFSTVGTVFENALSIITGIANAITALLSGDFAGAFEIMQGVVQTVWDTVCSILEAGWEIIKNLFQIGADLITDILTAVFDGVSGIVSNIADAIMDGLQVAIDWITGLPEQALKWGADIIQGIADGITGAIGVVTDAVKGIGEGITSFLGFSVPDEGPLADFESWMPDFMGGLASGIENSSGTVLGSVRALAGDIATLGRGATASVGTALSGAVTNNASTDNSVTQNVNISNSYSGSADAAARKVTSTMKKSAADTTTYLARALAYGKG